MDAGRVGSQRGRFPGTILNQPLLDALVADFGADEVQALFDLFAGDALARAGAMRSALDDGDGPRAARAAHALRSAAGSAGAVAFATVCERIEDAARGGDLVAARTAADSLGGELASATAALAEALGRGAGGSEGKG